jgi:hypothetical protein
VDIQANWLARALIADHAPRLRALLREHGDQVRLVSGHDSAGFAEAPG